MKTPSPTLVHVLIGKSILETLLVGGLALFAFMTVVPPYFHGWSEFTDDRKVAGWVVNNAAPWERVEVQLFVDGKFVATTVANQPRPDVLAAGWSKDQWHGYTFSIPHAGGDWHEVRVYAQHASGGGTRMSLQQVGDPLHFVIDSVATPAPK
jgi:hypothetical protein